MSLEPTTAPALDFRPVNEVQEAKKRRKDRQAFYTPLPLVDLLVSFADLYPTCRALEPSAGDGRICHAMRVAGVQQVDACEIDRERRASLEAVANVVAEDFLRIQPSALFGPFYDRIVMNPPFRGRTYVEHYEHAWRLLAPRGRIVGLAPTSMAELLDRCSVDLPGCTWASYEDLGGDWFKEFGAGISVLLVTIDRGADAPVLDFSNAATCNAALSIESTPEFLHQTKGGHLSPSFRAEVQRYLGKTGGSTYGINWEELSAHFAAREVEA